MKNFKETEYPEKKYPSRNFIVHRKPVAEIYGNLKFFCMKNKISYSTYSNKKFPFKVNDFLVEKVVRSTETISEYILRSIHNVLKFKKKEVCKCEVIKDELFEMKINFSLIEKKFEVHSFFISFPNGIKHNHNLTKKKIEDSINKNIIIH